MIEKKVLWLALFSCFCLACPSVSSQNTTSKNLRSQKMKVPDFNVTCFLPALSDYGLSQRVEHCKYLAVQQVMVQYPKESKVSVVDKRIHEVKILFLECMQRSKIACK